MPDSKPQNGVLGVIGNSYICHRIQDYTPQPFIKKEELWTHVAYLFYEDNKAYVIESHFKTGVHIVDICSWLELNKDNKFEFFPDNKFDVNKLKFFKGEKYGTKDILSIKLKTDLESATKWFYPLKLAENWLKSKFDKNNNGVFCSELLAECATAGGENWVLKAIDKPVNRIYPSNFQLFYYKTTNNQRSF